MILLFNIDIKHGSVVTHTHTHTFRMSVEEAMLLSEVMIRSNWIMKSSISTFKVI